MSLKEIKPILQIIGISVITSILFSALFFFLYFHTIAPSRKQDTTGSSKTLPKNTQFAKYEVIINDFLTTIRKGEIETAYKGTSPVFQKLTSLDDFKKLMNGYQSAHNIPSSSCSLTEYSDPFSSTINDLPNAYMIVQTKCETTENNEIKGFSIEFIDDGGKSKISYINAYKNPVIHKKE
ncbi:MAG: hypothetical protein NTY06_00615 [Candidatus Gottesmanbacteria bacterium]|nr:hypothetical protein [Candidatus Gottesmanbacteria bacterium]